MNAHERELAGLRPTPGRGRWIVIYFVGTGAIAGTRFTGKRRARGFARRIGGRLMRYHRRDWFVEKFRVTRWTT